MLFLDLARMIVQAFELDNTNEAVELLEEMDDLFR